jgi:hypothetical protein
MGLAMMLLVSGICLYTAYRILQTYTLHSRTVKISEFGDLCGLLLGTGSITPSSEENVEICRTGAHSRPSYQCCGYGSRVLMTKKWKKYSGRQKIINFFKK